ncbi:hypothetical protein QO010_003033 [Caulobacter ginsengisoli]|uniref:Uncharacterized protein n=1 Tax=Caulobacter ginsengisoli TaxID=400775 RepID=A0ABU0ITB8_9CAUL|nr:hypothetical protein [Caulobacter ginsengisoli]MDQ0465246.1 hypothetical protein [Caulobacter ginsengisoli]
MDRNSPKPFAEAARGAFPFAGRALAEQAIGCLSRFVDDSYRMRSAEFDVLGETVRLPNRLYFPGLSATDPMMAGLPPAALCLVSRATDGYLRQRAVVSLLGVGDAWAAPFVASLLADYVREIVEPIHDGLPALNRSIYANLVRENRGAFRVLRARATSYWAAYYRHLYPEKRDYPGLKALHEMEAWAA